MNDRKAKAEELHERAIELSDEELIDEAISHYLQALELDEARALTHYNLALEYKYRGEWALSLKHNLRAMELDPEKKGAIWNAGIAATALRQGRIARKAWQRYGIQGIEESDDPIQGDFGITPVRLNPDEDAEVVWGRRLCPARVRITNIPYHKSGFHYGDIVLNDGAPVGYRLLDGREVPVFNVLELFEPSGIETYVLSFELADETELEELKAAFEKSQLTHEHWTRNVRTLCKQCSEGQPHEQHDHDLPAEWRSEHKFAVASNDEAQVDAFLETWNGR